ncbi:M48 family metalloprotease [Brevundimonas sp.]|uniref:M48 family metalloprotease n=1 Tax=Brevundimonas sp. TaxID=1871086 RepID=UPI0025C5FF50|nr:M48 family metalloprotease [Brevundimonas sp.]
MRLSRRLCVPVAAGLIAAGLAGCSHPAATPADTGRVAENNAEARLTALVAKDQRVAAVAWRLTVDNADLCPATRLKAGWTLHAASQYGTELRPVAERTYGLQGDLPGILSAPAASPAQQAGLRPGDVIVAVDGQPLSTGIAARARDQTYDGLQANIDRLNSAATLGPMALTVRRDGIERSVTVTPERTCAYDTQVEVRDDLRALSDGRTIFVSARLVDIAQDDDQLAFLLAHELAHAVLEHATVPDVQGGRGEANAQLSLRRGLSSSSEGDADTLGLYLLARAGFDPGRAVQFLSAYEATAPGSRYPQVNLRGVYRSIPDRRRALEPVIADIARRQAAREPLIP